MCEQVQLLLAAKMRIFCRLPLAGYKTAVGDASTRRTIAGRGSHPLICGKRAQEPECRVYFLPFRQGQQCIWPEYSSLRNAWAFSFRLRRYRERWRGGHVGKKENRGYSPVFGSPYSRIIAAFVTTHCLPNFFTVYITTRYRVLVKRFHEKS